MEHFVEKSVLSPTGPELSQIIQGYWRLSEWNLTTSQTLDFIHFHLDKGITSIDHSAVYGDPPCERLFGEALSHQPSLRQELEIITKCGIKLSSTDHQNVHALPLNARSMIHAVEQTLKRLQTDYIDLLLLHQPFLSMPAHALADAITTLHQQGKIRFVGTSNACVERFAELQAHLPDVLVTNQLAMNPFNLNALKDGSLCQLHKNSMKPLIWSVLAGGRIFSSDTLHARRIRSTCESIKTEIGADTLEQVIYAWMNQLPTKPHIILGTGKRDMLEKAVEAKQYSLSSEQWHRLHRVADPDVK